MSENPEMRYSPAVVRSRGRSKQFAGSVLRRRRQERAREAAESAGEDAFYVQPVGEAPAADGSSGPDLLHETPRPWGDLAGTAELVRFAYEGGDCAGVFDTLIDATPLAPSSFDTPSFASQLYLDDLVGHCFHVEVEGRVYDINVGLLGRILAAPPTDADAAAARQAVFADLVAHSELRSNLERLYAAVRRLRGALEAGRIEEPNSVRRKLTVLEALKECIDALADGFADTDSLLGRLRAMGTAMREGEAYARLTELLEFDDNMATVDIRLRLGADGVMRGFAITKIQENTANALLPGPVVRFFQRLASLFRGYRYGESQVVVRLLEVVFGPQVDAVVSCLALTGPLEFYLAGLGFRDHCEQKGLGVCLPELVDASDPGGAPTPPRILEGIFNPLLFLQDIVPVPCDVPVPAHDALVVVTGPNSGGKTRLLQAIALVQCLGQVGMFVPAGEARLIRAPGLFVSLVIEQDAAQKEGRLGTELMRIRRLFEELEPGALAILDELCSGTNPLEGEEIFEMVVSLLPRLQPQVFISTHFLGLAARLEAAPPVEGLAFLEVELDDDERPTFGFIPGVAKTSLAHKVAARLGVTREELEALVADKAPRSTNGD
ncbi:MAG: DNA mismatch repair protein [Deltaproteobacteria bacterium]|nr:MAG: DNA mismatch repair protein [Deltaproteobacteria bacterium]